MFAQDAKYQRGDAPTAEGLAADVIISPDVRRENRIPPGQSRTRKWPVLDAFGTPSLPKDWKLEVCGLVDRPLSFTLDEFQQLPRVKVFADFHCVTQWSRLGNLWEGVSTRQLLELAGVRDTARFVILHGYDNNWTTNLPLEEFTVEDALLTDRHDGEPIEPDHGGPVRAMIPQLYAWKSAKWLKAIELSDTDKPGYWERGGYHLHGDPWAEERYRDDPAWTQR